MSLISAKSMVHSYIVQLLIQYAITLKKAFILEDVQQSIVRDILELIAAKFRLTSEYMISNSFFIKHVIVSADRMLRSGRIVWARRQKPSSSMAVNG